MASSAASADADEALPMLAVGGTSAKTLVGKVTAVAAFDRFLRSTSKYGAAAFDALSGEVLSDQPIWREFAHFLCDAEADGDKKGGTIVEYLRKTFAVAREKFAKQKEHAAFYAQLSAEADATNWFKGMIRQVR
jgi:hypothetical protein